MRKVHNSSVSNPEHESLAECKECGKIFPSNHSLIRHIKRTHTGVKVKCKECGTMLSSNHNLKRPTKRVHEQEIAVNVKSKEKSEAQIQ